MLRPKEGKERKDGLSFSALLAFFGEFHLLPIDHRQIEAKFAEGFDHKTPLPRKGAGLPVVCARQSQRLVR